MLKTTICEACQLKNFALGESLAIRVWIGKPSGTQATRLYKLLSFSFLYPLVSIPQGSMGVEIRHSKWNIPVSDLPHSFCKHWKVFKVPEYGEPNYIFPACSLKQNFFVGADSLMFAFRKQTFSYRWWAELLARMKRKKKAVVVAMVGMGEQLFFFFWALTHLHVDI